MTLRVAQKMWNASRFCVSSLRRGHANLLCIVPILVYVLPKQVHLGEQKIVVILRNFKVSAADVGMVFIKGRKYILRVSKPALLYQAWILSLENGQIANLSLIFAIFLALFIYTGKLIVYYYNDVFNLLKNQVISKNMTISRIRLFYESSEELSNELFDE